VFARIAPELQSRAQTLAEVPAQVDFLFAKPTIDEGSWDKAMGQPWAGKLLDGVITAFDTAPWDAAALEAEWREVSESVGAKPKLTQGPVRVAVTGRISGPPLFPALVELGRDETLRRLRVARERVPG
jgi:glutamyl-tRNA synthetase